MTSDFHKLAKITNYEGRYDPSMDALGFGGPPLSPGSDFDPNIPLELAGQGRGESMSLGPPKSKVLLRCERDQLQSEKGGRDGCSCVAARSTGSGPRGRAMLGLQRIIAVPIFLVCKNDYFPVKGIVLRKKRKNANGHQNE